MAKTKIIPGLKFSNLYLKWDLYHKAVIQELFDINVELEFAEKYEFQLNCKKLYERGDLPGDLFMHSVVEYIIDHDFTIFFDYTEKELNDIKSLFKSNVKAVVIKLVESLPSKKLTFAELKSDGLLLGRGMNRAAKARDIEESDLQYIADKKAKETPVPEIKPKTKAKKFPSMQIEKITLQYAKQNWEIKFYKIPAYDSDLPTYSLVLKSQESGEFFAFKDAVTFETGYDQGHAGPMNYYPMLFGSGGTNGSGNTRILAPFIDDRAKSHILSVLNDKSRNASKFEFQWFEGGTKLNEVKSFLGI